MFYVPGIERIIMSERELRAEFGNVSFPPVISSDVLEALGVFQVRQAEAIYDPITEGVREDIPALVDGHYVQQWEVYPLDADAVAANKAREAERIRREIDTERDSRIDAGFTFDGVRYQSRSGDRENIAGKALEAFMALVAGAQPGDLRWAHLGRDFAWIAADNSLVPMDAQTVVAFGKAASAHKEAHVFAARQLKDMQPIPADYADDKWWPAA